MGPMCPLLDAPGEPYEVVKGLSGTMTVKFKAEKERGLPQLGLKASSYSNAHGVPGVGLVCTNHQGVVSVPLCPSQEILQSSWAMQTPRSTRRRSLRKT